MYVGAARDHRSHAAPESGKKNHHDVDQQEEHESQGDEEMKRARGLLAAEQIDGRRNRGNKSGRHRQARPDHQGKQNEDHEQVGEPLEHVIRPGFRRARPLEAQMAGDRRRERPPRKIGPAGSKFFRKWPVNKPEITYSKPVNTTTQAA